MQAQIPNITFDPIRRAVAGTSCMISTGHHLATLAGLDILGQGGTAVDAAVGAGAVACVVLPHACGIGGDAFAIGFDARTNKVWALNASGRSPRRARIDFFPNGIDAEGVASTTVPGIVHGWAALLKRYGKRSLRATLSAAIRRAEQGFVINDVLGNLISANSEKLHKHPRSSELFFPEGRPLSKGDTLRQPALAVTLQHIAKAGARGFYAGFLAKEICSYVESFGGFLRAVDFASHKSKWEKSVISSPYYDFDICVPPPNSLAILLLVQLQLIAAASLSQISHNSVEYIKTMVQAKRLAFKRVLPLIADSDHMTIKPQEIVSSAFIKTLGAGGLSLGSLVPETPDTTTITVVDSEGNCVSLIQSLFHHFGCGAIAGKTGVLLNNRMSGFSLDPDSPNCVEGAKRPAHTLSPALVLKNRKPYLVIATPGAYAQTQTLCQVLNNVLVYKMEIQQALEAPRWFDDVDDVLLCENRIDPRILQALESQGYAVRVGDDWEAKTGSVQSILVQGKDEKRVFYGAADPRRHGCALGW